MSQLYSTLTYFSIPYAYPVDSHSYFDFSLIPPLLLKQKTASEALMLFFVLILHHFGMGISRDNVN